MIHLAEQFTRQGITYFRWILTSARSAIHDREAVTKLSTDLCGSAARRLTGEIGARRDQRFSVGFAQFNHQRMVGYAYGQRIKTTRQPAWRFRTSREYKRHRSRQQEKIAARCESLNRESSI